MRCGWVIQTLWAEFDERFYLSYLLRETEPLTLSRPHRVYRLAIYSTDCRNHWFMFPQETWQ